MRGARAAWLGVILVGAIAVPVGLWLWLDPFGPRRLRNPAECVVPLRVTHSCQGIDDSFTEHRYRFRAEGEPHPARCQAFLAAPPGAAHPETSEPTCNYEQPSLWERVPCASHALPDTMACFACEAYERKGVRRYVDAFAADCSREVVLAASNMSLE